MELCVEKRLPVCYNKPIGSRLFFGGIPNLGRRRPSFSQRRRTRRYGQRQNDPAGGAGRAGAVYPAGPRVLWYRRPAGATCLCPYLRLSAERVRLGAHEGPARPDGLRFYRHCRGSGSHPFQYLCRARARPGPGVRQCRGAQDAQTAEARGCSSPCAAAWCSRRR